MLLAKQILRIRPTFAMSISIATSPLRTLTTFNSPSPTTSIRTRARTASASLPSVSFKEYSPVIPSSSTVVVKEDHSFRKPPHASRSPCPALNALANHGYLPRDGHDITFSNIVESLQKGFGLSRDFAFFMAIGTFTLLRRPSLKPFDLAGTDRHNYIEHNASLTRDDCPDVWELGNNYINPQRLQEFLDKAAPTATSNGDDVITTADIASHRIQLEERCPAQLDGLHAELARAEFAMVMEIFGHGKTREVNKRDLEIFLKEERFPEGWKPTHTLQLWEAMARSKDIRTTMAAIKKKLESLRGSSEEEGIFGHVVHHLKALLQRKDAADLN